MGRESLALRLRNTAEKHARGVLQPVSVKPAARTAQI
jgi:hypothetical protein